MRAGVSDVLNDLLQISHPLSGDSHEYDPLIDAIGEARFVLLGEMTHGTHEFYQQRSEITKRLIREKGFRVIAVEADWPDAFRVNRFVRGRSQDASAENALRDFKRFPLWMWRNVDVRDFISWLRQYNDQFSSDDDKAGFYGLDLYSLHSSIHAVLEYLQKVDPEAAKRARQRYSCFDHAGEDAQAYGFAASLDLSASCEEQAIQQLVELRRKAQEYASRDGSIAADEYFFAEQNARLIKNAERYY